MRKIAKDRLRKQREQNAAKTTMSKEGDTLIQKETSQTGMVRSICSMNMFNM